MREAVKMFAWGLVTIALALIAGCQIITSARADENPWSREIAGQSAALHPSNVGTRPRNRAARGVKQSLTTGAPLELHALVTNAARRHGVPANVAHAIARIESGYRCSARSNAGARGLMQVLPATARGVGVSGNLFDCATGVEAGMRYLARIIARHGSGCAALGLYERGAHARPICTRYGRKALRLASMI